MSDQQQPSLNGRRLPLSRRFRPRLPRPDRRRAAAVDADAVVDLQRRHAVVERISRSVGAALDPRTVAEAACRGLLSTFDARFVTVREATPDGFQVLASASTSEIETAAFLRTNAVLPFEGNHLMSGLHRERAPRVFEDAQVLPSELAGRSRSAAIGLRGVAYVPLWTGDEFQGTISAGFGVPLSQAPLLDLDTLAVAGEFVAMALANARLYGQLQTLNIDLRDTRAQLVHSERLRALGELAAGVAHDFNNVLVLIQGHAGLLERRTADPVFRHGLGQIDRAVADGAALVARLQAFSRGNRVSTDIATAIDLSALVDEAVEMTRPRWSKPLPSNQSVEVVRTLPAGLPPIIGHAGELRQGCVNLVLNALDAMPRGGRLSVTTERSAPGDGPPRVRVRIADTGIGMPEEVRQRCLERFFTTKGTAGTGLGLSILRDVVEQHGGTIDIVSAPGRGTTFTLSFAAVVAPAPTAELVPVPARPPTGPLRVLVVDDDPDITLMLQALLEDEAHEITSCTSLGEAIGQFERREAAVDLLITDLVLNGNSGWELAERAKALRPHLPIVLLTGSVEHVDPEEAREHGIDHVLRKPGGVGALRPLLASLRTDEG